MCFDSKVVNNLKRLSYQLISSEVNIYAFYLRVEIVERVIFVYLDDRIRKTKNKNNKKYNLL